MTPTVEEIIARAIYAALPNYTMVKRPTTMSSTPLYEDARVDDSWEEAPDRHQDCLRQATSAIAALDAAGFVIAPKTATPEMLAAVATDVSFAEPEDYDLALRAVDLLPPTQHPEVADVLATMAKDYRAMLESRPQSPSGGER